MKSIYLHIGLGKTGTTTIQNHLGEFHHEYLQQGLHYIKASGGAHGHGHQEFAKYFIRGMPKYMQAPINAVEHLRNVEAEIKKSNEKRFLISSENFQLANPQEIKRFFDSMGESLEVKIILFVRSQDELAESEYNQIIKVRSESRSFEDYIADEFEGDFMVLAQKWEEVFGRENMICRVYDAKSQMALEHFFACFVGKLDRIAKTSSRQEIYKNTSLGQAQIVIKRMLNILQANEKDNLHVELPEEWSRMLKDMDIPAIFMSSKEAKKLRLKYHKSNKLFNMRYLGLKSKELGGQRYSVSERDVLYQQCKYLTRICK